MTQPQNNQPGSFYKDYGDDLKVSLTDLQEQIKTLHTKVTEISDGNHIPKSTADQLKTYMDVVSTGLKTKKEITNTAGVVINATANSASLIANIIRGEDVAESACCAVMNIGGAFVGAVVPPPYGQTVTAILGLIATFLGIVSEKREPSLLEQFKEILAKFEYSDLNSTYQTQISKLRTTLATITQDQNKKDLPYRIDTTMKYMVDLVNDQFEVKLISWADSDFFKGPFGSAASWENLSTAMAQSQIRNMAYEYICLKKFWLQSLITLLEITKEQMKEINMQPAKITPVNEHLHNVHNAFKALDISLRRLVENIFNVSATSETAAVYAALQTMASFGGMRTAYKKLTGKEPVYRQPRNGATVWLSTKLPILGYLSLKPFGGKVPQMLDPNAHEIMEMRQFTLQQDAMYPGCFNILGDTSTPQGPLVSGGGIHLWGENGSKLIPAASSKPDDTQRFIFIGYKVDKPTTEYDITSRSSVLHEAKKGLGGIIGDGVDAP